VFKDNSWSKFGMFKQCVCFWEESESIPDDATTGASSISVTDAKACILTRMG